MSSFNCNDACSEEPVAADPINRSDLKPYPEAGYYIYREYTEIYRQSTSILPEVAKYAGLRSLYTSIIYAMRVGDFSAFRQLSTEEVWYLHDGSPVELNFELADRASLNKQFPCAIDIICRFTRS